MTRQSIQTPLALISVSLLLTACGGGGSSSIITSSPFTSWSSVTPPETVTLSGMSTETTYDAPSPDFKVTDIGVPQESRTSSAKLTYNSAGELTRVSIKTPFSTVAWDEAAGDMIVEDTGVVGLVNANETTFGLAADPIDIGWEFQTFGTWITGFGLGTGRAGAISVGAATAGNDVPISGTTIFTGLTLGTYVDAAGEAYTAIGALTVDADFAARALDFRTSGTEKINLRTAFESAAGNLDMTGTLRYSAGSRSFSGTVDATGLSGTAKGQFYGPNAEELGGYFNLLGSGVEAYSGAFGAGQ